MHTHTHGRARGRCDVNEPWAAQMQARPFFRRINTVVAVVAVGIRPQCPSYWLACSACAVRVIHRGQRTGAPRVVIAERFETEKNKILVFRLSKRLSINTPKMKTTSVCQGYINNTRRRWRRRLYFLVLCNVPKTRELCASSLTWGGQYPGVELVSSSSTLIRFPHKKPPCARRAGGPLLWQLRLTIRFCLISTGDYLYDVRVYYTHTDYTEVILFSCTTIIISSSFAGARI